MNYITGQWAASGNPDGLKAAMLVGIVVLLLYIVYLVRDLLKELRDTRHREEWILPNERK